MTWRTPAAGQSLSDAFHDEMGDDEDFPITATQATCMGVDIVERIGVDELVEAGLLTEDLEAPEGDTEPLSPEMADTAAAVFIGEGDKAEEMFVSELAGCESTTA